MSQTRVARLNEFAKRKHPGLVGVELEICEPELVTGRMTVTEPVIAGTGFLWAPVVITLADWLCAAGMSPNLPEGASFTTVEMKTNFLGSAREARSFRAGRRPRIAARARMSGTSRYATKRPPASSRCSAARR